MKRCSRCGETKPLTEFHRSRPTKSHRGHADGLDYCCRRCRNARSLSYQRRVRIRSKQCGNCQEGEHGPSCLGPAANCACRCRPMLGLEGPFEFGDATAAGLGDVADPDEEQVA